ncbi:hypothetical protein EPN95_03015 [Patescibacteria group bacterium]|nr:MAG: hypothetical protein EPN95_03015 [Patescibacteria group bacterium]
MGDNESGEGRKHKTIQDVWGDEAWTASNFPGSKPTRKPNGEPLDEVAPEVIVEEVPVVDPRAFAKTAKNALDWM